MDDFGNDINSFTTWTEYDQWIVSTSTYGGLFASEVGTATHKQIL